MEGNTLIIGSSHVKHLKKFVIAKSLSNFDIEGSRRIKLFGISGGQVLSKTHLDIVRGIIKGHHPKHMIIHIGGNDIYSLSVVLRTLFTN